MGCSGEFTSPLGGIKPPPHQSGWSGLGGALRRGFSDHQNGFEAVELGGRLNEDFAIDISRAGFGDRADGEATRIDLVEAGSEDRFAHFHRRRVHDVVEFYEARGIALEHPLDSRFFQGAADAA